MMQYFQNGYLTAVIGTVIHEAINPAAAASPVYTLRYSNSPARKMADA